MVSCVPVQAGGQLEEGYRTRGLAGEVSGGRGVAGEVSGGGEGGCTFWSADQVCVQKRWQVRDVQQKDGSSRSKRIETSTLLFLSETTSSSLVQFTCTVFTQLPSQTHLHHNYPDNPLLHLEFTCPLTQPSLQLHYPLPIPQPTLPNHLHLPQEHTYNLHLHTQPLKLHQLRSLVGF